MSICFRDMTFCNEVNCKEFTNCRRALTEKVKEDANRWMKNAPISMFLGRPNCYKEK